MEILIKLKGSDTMFAFEYPCCPAVGMLLNRVLGIGGRTRLWLLRVRLLR